MTPSGSRGQAQKYLPISEIGTLQGAHVALIPGEDAPLISLALPDGLRGGAREQVARRQAADLLGLGSDVLDVRPFLMDGPLWSRVLVTAPDKIAGWASQISGTACEKILPDFLSLTAAKDVWTIDVREDRLLARLGLQDGFSAELPIARLQLPLAMATSPPHAVLWAGRRDSEIETTFKKADIPVVSRASDLKALGLQTPEILGSAGINLKDLAGAVLRQRRNRIVRWRAPFILAALAFGLWVSAQWIAIARNDTLTRATERATTEIVRQFFVPAGPLLDIRSQVARKAAELSQTGSTTSAVMSPNDLLRLAAARLAGQGLTLQSAIFRRGSGFEFSISARDFATLDALADALRSATLSVEVVSAESDGEGGVFGKIQIKEPS